MDTITNAPSYEWIIEAWLKNNILFPFPKNDIKTKTIGICHQATYMICDCYKHVLSYWSNISCGAKLIRGQTYLDYNDDDIDEIDMDAINAFFVTNYRDDQIDITTKKLLYYYNQPTTIVNAF